MQSVGVIRRDIEGDASYGLGRILLPAFLYHGSFDFLLMFLTGLNSLHSFETANDDGDGGSDATAGSGDNDGDERGGVATTVASFAVLLLGIVRNGVAA